MIYKSFNWEQCFRRYTSFGLQQGIDAKTVFFVSFLISSAQFPGDSGSCGHPHQGATLKGISPIMVDNIKC